MILQRPRIIVGDSGFEPGTSASEVWRAASEPPHLPKQSTVENIEQNSWGSRYIGNRTDGAAYIHNILILEQLGQQKSWH